MHILLSKSRGSLWKIQIDIFETMFAILRLKVMNYIHRDAKLVGRIFDKFITRQMQIFHVQKHQRSVENQWISLDSGCQKNIGWNTYRHPQMLEKNDHPCMVMTQHSKAYNFQRVRWHGNAHPISLRYFRRIRRR